MKPPNAPTTREALNALPEYSGKDADHVYEGDEKVAVTWIDAKGNMWWLAQRPDGSYCKVAMDD